MGIGIGLGMGIGVGPGAVPAAGGGGIPEALIVTGITDPVDSDPIFVTRDGEIDGYPAWSNADSWSVYKVGSGATWRVSLNSDYIAHIDSDAPSPVGLTGWTVLAGVGEPTVAELEWEPTPEGTTNFALYDAVQDDWAIWNPPLTFSQTYGDWELVWDGRWELKHSGVLRHYWNDTPQLFTPNASDDGGGGEWHNNTGI